jgi:hypothetical protein
VKYHPTSSEFSQQLSLEIVLGWSPLRISIMVLGPVLLSLAIGLWFQSKNPTDLATIQTAWGIASYSVTAGSCEFANLKPTQLINLLTRTVVAALLAILSSIGDK